jgi:polyisoprenoid-binding protein YceI
MKAKLRSVSILATALLMLAPAASLSAQEATVELDPARTQISYTLGATLHTVHGTFRLKSGTIRYDAGTGKADGLVVVDAASGNSGNGGRDRKMNKEILESGKYPEIVFVPLGIRGSLTPQGESRVELRGTFKLHGSEHEISIPAAVRIDGDQVNASGHFVVPYVEWGLKNPSVFFLRVSDKVEIDIHAAGRVSF